MAFLDDIQKSVTGAANYTAKKASKLSGIAKLKYNIRTEEANLERCYTDIGRLFYTAEREGVDHAAEISTLIMQADKINANIAGYRDELAKFKKTTVCDSCSAEVPKEFQFCPHCGAEMERECDAPEECGCGCGCEEAACDCDDENSSDCEENSCECGCGCDAADGEDEE